MVKSTLRLQHVFHEVDRRRILQVEEAILVRKNAREVFHWKSVVTSGDRRVCCEYAFAAHFLDVISADGCASGLFSFLTEQLQGHNRALPFLHVITRHLAVPAPPQHAYTT